MTSFKNCHVVHRTIPYKGIAIDEPVIWKGRGPFPDEPCVTVVFAANGIPSMRVVQVRDLSLDNDSDLARKLLAI